MIVSGGNGWVFLSPKIRSAAARARTRYAAREAQFHSDSAFQVVDIDDTFLDGALQNAAKCEKRDPTAKPFLIETLLASHTSKSLLQPLNLLRGHELNFPHFRLLCPFRVYVSIETASER